MAVIKYNLSEKDDLIQREFQNKPNFSDVIKSYSKASGNTSPDILDVLVWYKSKNKASEISNKIASDFIEAVYQPKLKGKLWTKNEWKQYKQDHPHTKIQPKFVEESQHKPIEQPKPYYSVPKIEEKPKAEPEKIEEKISPKEISQEEIKKLQEKTDLQKTKEKETVDHIEKSLSILKKKISPVEHDTDDVFDNISQYVTDFNKNPNSEEELTKVFDTTFEGLSVSTGIKIDSKNLSKHVAEALKNYQPSANDTPNTVISRVLTHKSKDGTSLLDLQEFKDAGEFINRIVTGLVKKNLLGESKYIPLYFPEHLVNKEKNLDILSFKDLTDKLNKSNQAEVKEASIKAKNSLAASLAGYHYMVGQYQDSYETTALRKAVFKQYEDAVNKTSNTDNSDIFGMMNNFQDDLRKFSGSSYTNPNFTSKVSAKIRAAFDDKNSPDFRMESGASGASLKALVDMKLPQREKDAIRLFFKREQQILIDAGLVDDEGYITLYRQTGHIKGKVGDETESDGNYIDSWGIRPETYGSGSIIRAKFHISNVISSCVGNDYHNSEAEVMVMGRKFKSQIRGHTGGYFQYLTTEMDHKNHLLGVLQGKNPASKEESEKIYKQEKAKKEKIEAEKELKNKLEESEDKHAEKYKYTKTTYDVDKVKLQGDLTDEEFNNAFEEAQKFIDNSTSKQQAKSNADKIINNTPATEAKKLNIAKVVYRIIQRFYSKDKKIKDVYDNSINILKNGVTPKQLEIADTYHASKSSNAADAAINDNADPVVISLLQNFQGSSKDSNFHSGSHISSNFNALNKGVAEPLKDNPHEAGHAAHDAATHLLNHYKNKENALKAVDILTHNAPTSMKKNFYNTVKNVLLGNLDYVEPEEPKAPEKQQPQKGNQTKAELQDNLSDEDFDKAIQLADVAIKYHADLDDAIKVTQAAFQGPKGLPTAVIKKAEELIYKLFHEAKGSKKTIDDILNTPESTDDSSKPVSKKEIQGDLDDEEFEEALSMADAYINSNPTKSQALAIAEDHLDAVKGDPKNTKIYNKIVELLNKFAPIYLDNKNPISEALKKGVAPTYDSIDKNLSRTEKEKALGIADYYNEYFGADSLSKLGTYMTEWQLMGNHPKAKIFEAAQEILANHMKNADHSGKKGSIAELYNKKNGTNITPHDHLIDLALEEADNVHDQKKEKALEKIQNKLDTANKNGNIQQQDIFNHAKNLLLKHQNKESPSWDTDHHISDEYNDAVKEKKEKEYNEKANPLDFDPADIKPTPPKPNEEPSDNYKGFAEGMVAKHDGDIKTALNEAFKLYHKWNDKAMSSYDDQGKAKTPTIQEGQEALAKKYSHVYHVLNDKQEESYKTEPASSELENVTDYDLKRADKLHTFKGKDAKAFALKNFNVNAQALQKAIKSGASPEEFQKISKDVNHWSNTYNLLKKHQGDNDFDSFGKGTVPNFISMNHNVSKDAVADSKIDSNYLWTKEEWEAYKKEHPNTKIDPKFKQEGSDQLPPEPSDDKVTPIDLTKANEYNKKLGEKAPEIALKNYNFSQDTANKNHWGNVYHLLKKHQTPDSYDDDTAISKGHKELKNMQENSSEPTEEELKGADFYHKNYGAEAAKIAFNQYKTNKKGYEASVANKENPIIIKAHLSMMTRFSRLYNLLKKYQDKNNVDSSGEKGLTDNHITEQYNKEKKKSEPPTPTEEPSANILKLADNLHYNEGMKAKDKALDAYKYWSEFPQEGKHKEHTDNYAHAYHLLKDHQDENDTSDEGQFGNTEDHISSKYNAENTPHISTQPIDTTNPYNEVAIADVYHADFGSKAMDEVKKEYKKWKMSVKHNPNDDVAKSKLETFAHVYHLLKEHQGNNDFNDEKSLGKTTKHISNGYFKKNLPPEEAEKFSTDDKNVLKSADQLHQQHGPNAKHVAKTLVGYYTKNDQPNRAKYYEKVGEFLDKHQTGDPTILKSHKQQPNHISQAYDEANKKNPVDSLHGTAEEEKQAFGKALKEANYLHAMYGASASEKAEQVKKILTEKAGKSNDPEDFKKLEHWNKIHQLIKTYQNPSDAGPKAISKAFEENPNKYSEALTLKDVLTPKQEKDLVHFLTTGEETKEKADEQHVKTEINHITTQYGDKALEEANKKLHEAEKENNKADATLYKDVVENITKNFTPATSEPTKTQLDTANSYGNYYTKKSALTILSENLNKYEKLKEKGLTHHNAEKLDKKISDTKAVIDLIEKHYADDADKSNKDHILKNFNKSKLPKDSKPEPVKETPAEVPLPINNTPVPSPTKSNNLGFDPNTFELQQADTYNKIYKNNAKKVLTTNMNNYIKKVNEPNLAKYVKENQKMVDQYKNIIALIDAYGTDDGLGKDNFISQAHKNGTFAPKKDHEVDIIDFSKPVKKEEKPVETPKVEEPKAPEVPSLKGKPKPVKKPNQEFIDYIEEYNNWSKANPDEASTTVPDQEDKPEVQGDPVPDKEEETQEPAPSDYTDGTQAEELLNRDMKNYVNSNPDLKKKIQQMIQEEMQKTLKQEPSESTKPTEPVESKIKSISEDIKAKLVAFPQLKDKVPTHMDTSFLKGIDKVEDMENPNPSPRDLMLLKKALGKKGNEYNVTDLLIIFKAMANHGYFKE